MKRNSITMSIVAAFLIEAATVASAQRIGTKCITPNQEDGSCMPLNNCTSVYNLLQKNQLTPQDRQFLVSSQCGLAPDRVSVLVCCSDKGVAAPKTDRSTSRVQPKPSVCGDQASCVELEKCEYLFNLLKKKPLLDKDKEILKRSHCGFAKSKVLVCCSDEYIGARQHKIPTSGLLPKPGVCGNEMSNRVYGGSVARICEFPWLALILYDKVGPRCGGSLINDRYVLTAAHCIQHTNIKETRKPIRVRLGEWDTTTDRDCEKDTRGLSVCADPHIDVPIESVVIHPNYTRTFSASSRTVTNDIALIRLSRSVTYTDFIQPICLPIKDSLKNISFDGVALDVAGWRLTENSTSNLKMKAIVRGVPSSGCQRLYNRYNIQNDSSQICAGGEKGADSCTGDSGGPLITLDASDKSRYYQYIAGITSFGPTPCTLQGWPRVYTKVSSYVDWIQETIEP